MDNYYILVVDDNHINRLFFESSFKKHGFRVCSAEDGYKAIKLCQQEDFDLILMDIRMTGLDGIQTAAAIKSQNIQPHTPIIAVSAEQFDYQEHAEFESCLLKPISQNDIKNLIARHLSSTACFDQHQAMKISHDDEQIVQKLRHLLIIQLPKDWQQIERMTAAQEWTALNALLHKMLGSAKVCAASLLIKEIENFQTKLKSDELRSQAFLQLHHAIEKTLNQ